MSSRPLILLVDTSLAGARLGLVERGSLRMIWQGSTNEVQGSAARLPAMLDEGLRSAVAEMGDLCGVLVSSGPGSFTVIRVGIAFARGLSSGLGRPVAGCSSLGLLAAGLATSSRVPVAIFSGATATNGYLAFSADGKPASVLAVSVESFPQQLAGLGNLRVMVAADWHLMRSMLSTAGLAFESVPPAKLADDALAWMLDGVSSLPFEMSYSEHNLDPVYLRRSSVEERTNQPVSPGPNTGGGAS